MSFSLRGPILDCNLAWSAISVLLIGVIGEIYPCSTSYQQAQGLLYGFDMFFLLVLLTIRKNTK